MKRIAIFLAVVALILTSCREYHSKADYFNGKILVEYYQTSTASEDDNVTFTFNDEGTYKVTFACTPSKKCNVNPPEGFTIEVKGSPSSKVVNQHVLPWFLDVTIERNQVAETHHFQ